MQDPLLPGMAFYIWPMDIFFFILISLAAERPCFTILCTRLTEASPEEKKLVPDKSIQLLAKILGVLLALYMVT
jgi:hypothetical protein